MLNANHRSDFLILSGIFARKANLTNSNQARTTNPNNKFPKGFTVPIRTGIIKAKKRTQWGRVTKKQILLFINLPLIYIIQKIFYAIRNRL